MTTIIIPFSPALNPPIDPPIEYGYRDITTTRPDGTSEWVRIPLTLEDCLHPEMGDVILESSLHDLIRDYLADVFRWKTADDPGALVVSDVGIYWDIPELKHHSPDVSVIFGVQNRKTNYKSFHVSEEKTRPRLLMELVSPKTRKNDVETKVLQYHRAGVAYYVILDRETEDGPWILRGYQWTPSQYLEMPKDEQGRLWLEPVGVWIAVQGQTVICYDGKTGEPIGDYTLTRKDLVKQRASTESERTRADEEKARAEAEKARAEAEKVRANEEKTRAEAEARARESAEQRLRELEAELAKLKQELPPDQQFNP